MILGWELVLGWLVISSLAGFILMGIDKARARDGSWRIPERVFFELAVVGGAFGIVAGSSVFHHKTSKPSFIVTIIVIALIWVAALVELQDILGPPTV
ncbi:MAG: DUF1294 domain-containing protein [Thaumarchaeota archaeon]|nr:DUF1294 domain-containing protein [Nitrososphaerota archaeon]